MYRLCLSGYGWQKRWGFMSMRADPFPHDGPRRRPPLGLAALREKDLPIQAEPVA
jgi:hypothetical protein